MVREIANSTIDIEEREEQVTNLPDFFIWKIRAPNTKRMSE